ncbi:enoyl-CoA hydratase/isomerase family protein [Microbacterium sp. zg-Y818]|uniref:enoyl-CoA hydratase/isomerase family protein n=1 Tax=unclassified Microbacterium TaxID=2609290 RepID=UPI00214B0D5E|nr:MULTISPECIES: enoyl-CoA hydratase/isomerase family protein [unclassified Microbacterium]MCR2799339.1 enoyl-CoA hydratase/isomerase family protein [Microbacterium sp. zg.Y818]WIM21339.1 enoyl-CoA hydratase/isomerase family protein [Microbacterium sp. zg-Y818]
MTDATETFVEFERSGEVAVIRLNRPERMNAMGAIMLGQLRGAYRLLAEDDSLRVGVLTGTGRGFCAGRDIKEGAEAGARLQDQATTANTDLFMENNSAKPVVAAVNGYAGGAGFYLGTRAADFSVAARSAVFQIAEVPRGILHGWQTGFWMNLSRAAAQELALGMKVSGQRAYDMGLVNRFCEDEELLDVALSVAREIAAMPQEVIRDNRALLRGIAPTVPREVVDAALEMRLEIQRRRGDGDAEFVSSRARQA